MSGKKLLIVIVVVVCRCLNIKIWVD